MMDVGNFVQDNPVQRAEEDVVHTPGRRREVCVSLRSGEPNRPGLIGAEERLGIGHEVGEPLRRYAANSVPMSISVWPGAFGARCWRQARSIK